MAKKQQIILLHGSEKFTNKALLTKGELAVEHGATAAEVKIHTLDNTGEIASFASQAYIDNAINGVTNRVAANESSLTTLKADKDTEGSIAHSINAAKSDLTTSIDNAVSGINSTISALDTRLTESIGETNADVEELGKALSAETSARESAISSTLESAKAYTDELKNGIVANNTAAISANTTDIATIKGDYLKASDKTELSNLIAAETSARESAISAETSARESADNAIKGMIGTVAEGTNLAGLIAAETSAREAAISAETSARTSAVSGLQAQIDNLDSTYAKDTELAAAVSGLTSQIESAKNSATTKVVEGTDAGNNLSIANSENEDGNTVYTINLTDVASANALSAVQSTVTTLVGSETELKSVREIANQEATSAVANVIYNAPEAFNTLKEIADWIGSGEAVEGTTAADMLTSIQQNTAAISAETSAREVADNGLQAQITTISNDYLKASDKTELNNAITTETNARESADNAIKDMIGTVAEGTNLAGLIAAETSARTSAVSGLQAQIDNLDSTYAKDTELAAAVSGLTSQIESAKNSATTKVVEGTDAGNNLSIANSTNEDGNTVYTINLTDVASANALSALDTTVGTISSNYVKSVQVVSNGTTHTYTPTNNVLDLSEMVIDGGTY